MHSSAQVHSIDNLRALHAALAEFGPSAGGALDSAALEIRRTLDGLEDQLKLWQGEVYKRQEDVNRARADLSHARALNRGERTGATEQEIALLKAQQRLRQAEDKVKVIRRWQRLLPEAVQEYEGVARRLAGMLEADLRQALAVLEGKIAALAAYVALPPPGSSEPPAASPEPPGKEQP